MYVLRYYCQGSGVKVILNLLRRIKDKHQLPYEINDLSTNGQYDPMKEKAVYEKDFKPRAKVLKRATERSITELRSAKHGNYYVSIPGTVALICNQQITWWTHTEKDITEFLRNLLLTGKIPLEGRSSIGKSTPPTNESTTSSMSSKALPRKK